MPKKRTNIYLDPAQAKALEALSAGSSHYRYDERSQRAHERGPEPLEKLMHSLYGHDIWRDTEYCNWLHRVDAGKNEKVDAVLVGPEDWYWLEDPLYGDDLLRLREAGLESRYIQVHPRETWAFADACKKLFALTGVDAERLSAIGAKMEWFEHS